MSLINLSKQTDLLGTDLYRNENPAVPLAYRQTITHSVAKSPSSLSHSVNVRSVAPVLKTVDGTVTSSDSFLMTTKFTALQHVVDDTLRAKIYDDHVAFLIASRNTNLNGGLPKTAVTITR